MQEYIDSEAFINDFKEGNRLAFRAVFEMYFPRIYCFCLKLVRKSDEAEDIATDAFAKTFRRCGQLNSHANIRGFLYVASRNGCLKYFGQKKKTEAAEEDFSKMLDENDYVRLNDEMDGMYIQLLLDTIKKLPPRQGELMEKLYVKRLDYQTASAEMGVKVDALYVLHNKAISSIKGLLRSDGLAESVMLILVLERCFGNN